MAAREVVSDKRQRTRAAMDHDRGGTKGLVRNRMVMAMRVKEKHMVAEICP